MKRFVLRPGLIVPGLLVGAATGAGLVIVTLTSLALTQTHLSVAPASSPMGFVLGAALIFAMAFAFYVAGLMLVGVPAWIVAHVCGARSWPAAMLLGAVLNAGVVLLLAAKNPRPDFSMVPLFGGLGAVVGWTVWRTAYRRNPEAGKLS